MFDLNFTKTFLTCLLMMGAGLVVAQEADQAPEGPIKYPVISGDTPEEVVAQWDLQFAYDVSTDAQQFSLSNGVYLGGEFWAAEWNSDTYLSFDSDGTFVEEFTIGGLSGTRALGYDGTNVYAANASNTIYTVDPVTRTVTNSFVIASPDPARFAAFNPDGNGGAGSFFIGDFNTDITEVAFDGSVLNVISADTHTLGGMYGAAYDNQSPGGPYLWVFHQPDEPSDAVITQLQMPAGTPTGVGRDVTLDFGTADDLAGGLFISDQWVGDGTLTIGGVAQGNPDILFGYELSFEPGPIVNAGVSDITSPVTACGLSDAEVVTLTVRNDGLETVSDIPLTLIVNDEELATEIFAGPLAPDETATYSFTQTIDMSAPGLFFIDVLSSLDGDVNNGNDLTSTFAAAKQFDNELFVSEGFDQYEQFDFIFENFYNEGDIGWFVNSGETGSSDTGPSGDASGNGNYIYMEASGFDVGDQAILGSNCLDLTGFKSITLAFFYHMYGAGIGSLNITAVPEGGSPTNIFSQVGQVQMSTGDEWDVEIIEIEGFQDQVIQLFFTGEIGEGGSTFQSDIALDNIELVGIINGVDEIADLKNLNVLPVPATDFLQVELEFDNTKDVRIQLFNNLGQEVVNEVHNNVLNGVFDIEVANLQSGMYQLRILADGEIATRSVVVQK